MRDKTEAASAWRRSVEDRLESRMRQMQMINAAALHELCSHALPGSGPDCACRAAQTQSWESITEERWPAAVLKKVGTLRQADLDEPTFEEFHPKGTRYDAPDAPIALSYFPFNRSDVYVCSRCRKAYLRYTEYGGYYVDHRVRMVRADLIVDGF
ncbi:MAG: hypothetical protein EON54_15890 [Alcaligenaceae bacterium]|nr:MAG: hypothetical protein EON54_15890 [Alcaligenaceae bacterium]